MTSTSTEISTWLLLLLSYLVVRWMSMMLLSRQGLPMCHLGHHATHRTHTTDKHDLA